MELRIEVTQDDIENGKRCYVNSCPIALAAGRAAGDGYDVFVSRTRLRLYKLGQPIDLVGLLPVNVVDFIADFDRGLPVAPPESFTIILKDEVRDVYGK